MGVSVLSRGQTVQPLEQTVEVGHIVKAHSLGNVQHTVLTLAQQFGGLRQSVFVQILAEGDAHLILEEAAQIFFIVVVDPGHLRQGDVLVIVGVQLCLNGGYDGVGGKGGDLVGKLGLAGLNEKTISSAMRLQSSSDKPVAICSSRGSLGDRPLRRQKTFLSRRMFPTWTTQTSLSLAKMGWQYS